MLKKLYDIAERNGIDIDYFHMKSVSSMSIHNAIAIDETKMQSEADENVHLAHELGHCTTGSFYNINSKYDIKEKHEYTADKWAIKTLIPFNQLLSAIEQGINETWSLAEHFSVTESFIKKTLNLYEEKLINLRLDKEV